MVRERGVSVAQAARDLDVHEAMLHRWVKQAAADLEDDEHDQPGEASWAHAAGLIRGPASTMGAPDMPRSS